MIIRIHKTLSSVILENLHFLQFPLHLERHITILAYNQRFLGNKDSDYQLIFRLNKAPSGLLERYGSVRVCNFVFWYSYWEMT